MDNTQTITNVFDTFLHTLSKIYSQRDTFKNRLDLSEASYSCAAQFFNEADSIVLDHNSVILTSLYEAQHLKDLVTGVSHLSKTAFMLCNATDEFVKNKSALRGLLIKESISKKKLMHIPSNEFVECRFYGNPDLYCDIQASGFDEERKKLVLAQFHAGSDLMSELNGLLDLTMQFMSTHAEIVKKPGANSDLCNELSKLAHNIHIKALMLPDIAKLFVRNIESEQYLKEINDEA